MNKVLVVEESGSSAQIYCRLLEETFNIPFPNVDSLETALEEFITSKPTLLIMEIVMAKSSKEKEEYNQIEARQRDIQQAQEKLEDIEPTEKTMHQQQVMNRIIGLNFFNQAQLLDYAGGLELVRLIKEYCVRENICMPKVVFYTTQELYEHMQTLNELFQNRSDYIWVSKCSINSPERLVNAVQKFTNIEPN